MRISSRRAKLRGLMREMMIIRARARAITMVGTATTMIITTRSSFEIVVL